MEWTKDSLWELRQEIVLGSLFASDYHNSFGVQIRECQGFFYGYLEEIQFKMEGDGKCDIDNKFFDYLGEYDNPDTLWDWYYCFDNDPLPIATEPEVPKYYHL